MMKYEHLVHTFKKMETHWGSFMPPVQAYFRGHDCMRDSTLYTCYRCYMDDAFLDKEANFHTEEEYLCFTGYDMLDPWGSFDAEIEFWIGSDLGKLEQHIFTKPTIVRIPPYVWHCPLQFRNVKKPVYLQVIHTRGKFGYFYYKFHDDGSYSLEYRDYSGTRTCRLDPSKSCTLCGKCWKMEKHDSEPQNATEAALRYRELII